MPSSNADLDARRRVVRFFADADFEFASQILVGSAATGGCDVGEVLSTIGRIPNGDGEAWFTEWTATGHRVRTIAERAEKAGHLVSAGEAWLRAASYLGTAIGMSDRTADPARLKPAWRAHRKAWDRWLALHPSVVPLAIPYEGKHLPAWLFLAEGAGPRPLAILNNGSDATDVDMWCWGAPAALARGWHTLLFDGPGQQSMLFEHGVPFRPDWEAVLGPVLDAVVTRPEIDAGCIAVVGVSQAGYWVARAAAHEPRIKAIVLDPGVDDVGASWFAHLAPEMTAMLDDPAKQKDFDAFMKMATDSDPAMRAMLQFRMRPYATASPFEAFRAVRAYTLTGVVERIECPTLLLEPEGEQFWPGQSQRLYDALRCPKHLVKFTAAEGGDLHCEPKTPMLRNQRVFDWLAETL